MKRSFIILLLLLLNGCQINRAVIAPYAFAPSGVEEMWTPKIASKKNITYNKSVPEPDHPLSLAEVLDIALLNNTNTQATWSNAREAAAAYGESQSTFLPRVEGELVSESSRSPILMPNDVASTANTRYGPRLALTYTLFDFGQRKASTLSARYALHFADWTHNRAVQSVIQRASSQYYALLSEQAQLRALEVDVETASRSLEVAEVKYREGVQDIADVLQSKSNLLERQTDLVIKRRDVQIAYTDLAVTMGLPSNCIFELQELPLDPKCSEITQSLDEMIEIGLNERADYQAAQAALRSAQEDVTVAQRARMPVLDFSGDVGRAYFNKDRNDNYNYTARFGIKVPLFTGFQLRNAIQSAKAREEQVAAELKRIELEVSRDISVARTSIIVAREAVELTQQLFDNAEKQYDVAFKQYRAGMNSNLDLLLADTALSDARAKRIEAIEGWYDSLAQLEFALGKINLQESKACHD